MQIRTENALGLRSAADYYASNGDVVAAITLDNLARQLESGMAWPELLDDTEVRP